MSEPIISAPSEFDAIPETGSGIINLPVDESIISNGAFQRSGDSLLIIPPDGTSILLRDYFNTPAPPDIGLVGGTDLSFSDVQGLISDSSVSYEGLSVAPGTSGIVADFEGQVTITRNGVAIDITQGSPILEGDIIRTGPNGHIDILFSDQALLSLGRNAELLVDDYNYPALQNEQPSAQLSILEGSFALTGGDIARNFPGQFILETPVAGLNITGSKIIGSFNQASGHNVVTAIDGIIRMYNDAGQAETLLPFSSIRTNSALSQPIVETAVTSEQLITLYNNFFGNGPESQTALNDFLSTPLPNLNRYARERNNFDNLFEFNQPILVVDNIASDPIFENIPLRLALDAIDPVNIQRAGLRRVDDINDALEISHTQTQIDALTLGTDQRVATDEVTTFPEIATANINEIRVVFSTPLHTDYIPQLSDFTVRVTSALSSMSIIYTPTSYTITDNRILTFTLPIDTRDSDLIDLLYSGPQLRGANNLDVRRFDDDNRLENIAPDSPPLPLLSDSEGDNSIVSVVFDELLDTASLPPAAAFTVVVGGVTQTITAVAIVNNVIELTLATPLPEALATPEITISYDPAMAIDSEIQDLGGLESIAFSGQTISNTTDNVPPTLLRSTVDLEEIILFYNENLDENSLPDPGDFNVTIGGNPALNSVQTVRIQGDQVILTLADPIFDSDVVTLDYDPTLNPAGDPLQDLKGNDAPILGSSTVTNITNTPPLIISAEVENDILTLTFNQNLDAAAPMPDPAAFSLSFVNPFEVTGSFPISILSVAVDPTTLSLLRITLNRTIPDNNTLRVTYTPPTTNPIIDPQGDPSAAFTTFPATNNTPDDIPVLITGIVGDPNPLVTNNRIVLQFDQPLDTDPTLTPSTTQFQVSTGAGVVTPVSVTVIGRTVILTLQDPMTDGNIVTIDYTPPTTVGAPGIYDVDGNPAAVITNNILDNRSDDTAPMLSSSELEASTLTLTFDQPLDQTSIPTSGFTVTINNVEVELTGFPAFNPLNMNQVILTLDNPAGDLADYSVIYNPPASGSVLRELHSADATLKPVPSFGDTGTAGTPGNVPELLDLNLQPGVGGSNDFIELIFNQDLDPAFVPDLTSFGLIIPSYPTAVVPDVMNVMIDPTNPHIVRLELSENNIADSTPLSVTYNPPAINQLRDAGQPGVTPLGPALNVGAFGENVDNELPDRPPVLLESTVESDASGDSFLTLVFNQTLDGASLPLASDFTLNSPEYPSNVPISISTAAGGIVITDNRLALRLDKPIGDGIDISFSYTGTSLRDIDTPGSSGVAKPVPNRLPVMPISNESADNNVADSPPQFLYAEIDQTGEIVTVYFNQPLDDMSIPDPTDLSSVAAPVLNPPFAIILSEYPDDPGRVINVTNIMHEARDTAAIPPVYGNRLVFTLSQPVGEGTEVELRYVPTATSNPIRDLSGNDMLASNYNVDVNAMGAAPAPELLYAEIVDNEVFLYFNEGVDAASLPSVADLATSFIIDAPLLGGTGIIVPTMIEVPADPFAGVTGEPSYLVKLTLNQRISDGIQAQIQYIPPTTLPLQDSGAQRTDALGFTSDLVNNSPDTPPALSSGGVDGTEVTLEFDQPIGTVDANGAAITLDPARFAVQVDAFEDQPVVTNVMIVPADPSAMPPEFGNKVILTLDRSVGDNTPLSVVYDSPDIPLGAPLTTPIDYIVDLTSVPNANATQDFDTLDATTPDITNNAPDAAPVVHNIELLDNMLSVEFDQPLDDMSMPVAGDFTLNISEFDQNPEIISVSFDPDNSAVLLLELNRPVGAGITPTLDYASGTPPLQEADVQGTLNPVAGFTLSPVIVGSDAGLAPRLFQAEATADITTTPATSIITLRYDKLLEDISTLASANGLSDMQVEAALIDAFTINFPEYPDYADTPEDGNIQPTITNIIIRDNIVEIAIDKPVGNGMDYLLSFDATGLPTGLRIRDVNGQEADLPDPADPNDAGYVNLEDSVVAMDATAPQLLHIIGNGDQVVLYFNEDMDVSSLPTTGDFTIEINGIPVVVTGVDFPTSSITPTFLTTPASPVMIDVAPGRTLSLTLQNPIADGSTITLDYTGTTLQDAGGNDLAAITDYNAENESPDAPPVLIMGEVIGTEVTLEFDQPIGTVDANGAAITLDPARFAVQVDAFEDQPVVTNVMIVPADPSASPVEFGNKIILTLDRSVGDNTPLSVVYDSPDIPLGAPLTTPIDYIVDLTSVPNANATQDFDTLDATTPDITNNAPDAAPIVHEIELLDNILTIEFDQPLDDTSMPVAGDFTLNIPEFDQNPTIVSVSFDPDNSAVIILQLNREVGAGIIPTLDYAPGTPPLQEADVQGTLNPVAGFTLSPVIVGSDAGLAPRLFQAEATADITTTPATSIITLRYDKLLEDISTLASANTLSDMQVEAALIDAFTINFPEYPDYADTPEDGNIQPTITNIIIRDNIVEIAIDKPVGNGMDYLLSFDATGLPAGLRIRDVNGQEADLPDPMDASDAKYVNLEDSVVALDATAPQLLHIIGNGDQVVLYFNEDMDVLSSPATGDFTIEINGIPVVVTGVDFPTSSITPTFLTTPANPIIIDVAPGRTVSLTLQNPIADGSTITLDYTGTALQDTGGNNLAAITDYDAENETPDTAPALSMGEVIGTEVTLEFDQPIGTVDANGAAITLDPARFTVQVDAFEDQPVVTGIQVVAADPTAMPPEFGNKIILTLDRSVGDNTPLSVVYDSPDIPLGDPLTMPIDYIVDLTSVPNANATQDFDTLDATTPDITNNAPDAAPVVHNIELLDNMLSIEFDQPLDDMSMPVAGDFILNISEFDQNPEIISVSFDPDNSAVLLLELNRPVGAGITPTLDYASGATPLQEADAQGTLNPVAGFTLSPVIVGSDAGLAPRLFQAEATADITTTPATSIITLRYDKLLEDISTLASANTLSDMQVEAALIDAFTINFPEYPDYADTPEDGNIQPTITNIIIRDNIVEIAIDKPVGNGMDYLLSFDATGLPAGLRIRDVNGQEADLPDPADPNDAGYVNLEDSVVALDATAPQLLHIIGNGDQVVLYFNEDMDVSSRPATGDFTIEINGIPVVVTGVDFPTSSITPTFLTTPDSPIIIDVAPGRTVSLTLQNPIADGSTITLDYTGTALQDTGGNNLAAITDYDAENETPDTAPALSMGEVIGTEVTLEFDQPIGTVDANGAAITLDPARFAVQVDAFEDQPVVTNVMIVPADSSAMPPEFGNKIILTLDRSVGDNTPLSVVYDSPDIPLGDPLTMPIDYIVDLTSVPNANATQDFDTLDATTPDIMNNAPDAAPVVHNIELLDNMLSVEFDQPLDDMSMPVAGDFTLNISEFDQNPEIISVSFDPDNSAVLLLELNRPVGAGITPTLDYASGTPPLQEADVQGTLNPVAGFTLSPVIVGSDAGLAPRLFQAEAAADITTTPATSIITLRYDKLLEDISTLATANGLSDMQVEAALIDAFTINFPEYPDYADTPEDGNIQPTITNIIIRDNIVEIAIDKPVGNGMEYLLSFDATGLPAGLRIRDVNGQEADLPDPSDPNDAGYVNLEDSVFALDATAPQLLHIIGNGDQVVLHFNEGMNISSRPTAGDFTIEVNGIPVVVSNVDFPAAGDPNVFPATPVDPTMLEIVPGRTVRLTLQNPIADGSTITLDYTGTALQDAGGNNLAAITDYNAENETPDTAPALSIGEVVGTEVTLEFDQPIGTVDANGAAITLDPARFTVNVDAFEDQPVVTGIQVVAADPTAMPPEFGNKVILTLDRSVGDNTPLSVVYDSPDIPLGDPLTMPIDYIIDLTNNATADFDTLNANVADITNGAADAAPMVHEIELLDNMLTIEFDQPLDDMSMPVAGDFILNIPEFDQNPTIVSVSFDPDNSAVLLLELNRPVGAGITPTLDYASGTPPLQEADTQGTLNPVAGFTLSPVIVGSDAGLAPRLFQAEATADITTTPATSIITLRYDKLLEDISTLATANTLSDMQVEAALIDAFTINFPEYPDYADTPEDGNIQPTITNIIIRDNIVEIAIDKPVGNGMDYLLSFDATGLPAGLRIRDVDGQEADLPDPMDASDAKYVNLEDSVVALDATAPQLLHIVGNGDQVVLHFNEDMDVSSPPATGDFTIEVNGIPVVVSNVDFPAAGDSNLFPVTPVDPTMLEIVPGRTVRLTLQTPIADGSTITLDYTGTALQDTGGNDLAAITDYDAENETPDTPPALSIGEVIGTEVTLEFDQPIGMVDANGAAITLDPARFTVNVDAFEDQPVVTNVIIVPADPSAMPPEFGNKVILTLDRSVGDNTPLSVIYDSPDIPLGDPLTTPIDYIIDLTNNATADFDTLNANIADITNGAADAAPMVHEIELLDNMLTIEFDQPLDDMSMPAVGDFILNIPEFDQNPTIVSVSFDPDNSAVLLLELNRPVGAGITPTLDYASGTPPLQEADVQGTLNPVAGFTLSPVIVGSDAGLAPRLFQAEAAADITTTPATSIITLRYDKVLEDISTLAPANGLSDMQVEAALIDAFTINFPEYPDYADTPEDGNIQPTITNIIIRDNIVEITIDKPVGNGMDYLLSFDATGLPAGLRIRDVDGQEADLPDPMDASDAKYVNLEDSVVALDATAPQLLHIIGNGDQVVLYFNEDMDVSSLPTTGDFTIEINGIPVVATGVSFPTSSITPTFLTTPDSPIMIDVTPGRTVSLTLQTPIADGSIITLDYTGTALQDTGGNDLAAITDYDAENETPDTPPVLSAITLNTDSNAQPESFITLQFDQPITINGLRLDDTNPMTPSVPALTDAMLMTIIGDFTLNFPDVAFSTDPTIVSIEREVIPGTTNLNPTKLILRLDREISDQVNVNLTYDFTAATTPIEDTTGNGFEPNPNSISVNNINIDSGLTILNVVVDSASMEVFFDEPFDSLTPAELTNLKFNFFLLQDNTPAGASFPQSLIPEITSVSVDPTFTNKLIFSLTPPALPGMSLDLQYFQDPASLIEDTDAMPDALAGIFFTEVENITQPGPPIVLSAVVAPNGESITIRFNNLIDTATIPQPIDGLSVTIDDVSGAAYPYGQPTITGVTAVSNEMIITLDSANPILDGSLPVKITYDPTSPAGTWLKSIAPLNFMGAASILEAENFDTTDTTTNSVSNSFTLANGVDDNEPELITDLMSAFAPQLEIDGTGSKITLQFDQPLNSANPPATGDFNVEFLGRNITINNVMIDPTNPYGVILTLTEQPADRSTPITVDYTGTTLRDVDDMTGTADDADNQVDMLNNVAVNNDPNIPDNPPEPTAISVNGNIIIVTFDQPIMATSFDAADFAFALPSFPSDVTIGVMLAEHIPEDLSLATPEYGNKLRLTLDQPIGRGIDSELTYMLGAAPIEDATGNALLAFDTNTSSTLDVANVLGDAATGTATEPVLLRAEIGEDDLVTLFFNQPLDTSSIPAVGDFAIMVDGTAITPQTINIPANPVATITGEPTYALTIEMPAGTIRDGSTGVDIIYTPPMTNPIQSGSGAGLQAGTLTVRTATQGAADIMLFNELPDDPPELLTGIITEDAGVSVITLTFDQQLNTMATLNQSEFNFDFTGYPMGEQPDITNVAFDPTNPRAIIVTLDQKLGDARDNIDDVDPMLGLAVSFTYPVAGSVQDTSGNNFVLTATDAVTLDNQMPSSDPTLFHVSGEGDMIELYYDQPLDPASLNSGAFTVIFPGYPATSQPSVTNIVLDSTDPNKIILTLGTPIADSDIAIMIESTTTTQPMDLAGNAATPIATGTNVINTETTNQAPVLLEANANSPTQIILFFNQNLDQTTALDPNAFSLEFLGFPDDPDNLITRPGETMPFATPSPQIASVAFGAFPNQILITLNSNSPIPDTTTQIEVEYAPTGTGDLIDASGQNSVIAISDETVVTSFTLDSNPSLLSSSVNGNKLVLYFDQPMSVADQADLLTDFTVSVTTNGVASTATITSVVVGSGDQGNHVILILGTPVIASTTALPIAVTLNYVADNSGQITDQDGNTLPSFAMQQMVENITPPGPPILFQQEINGNTVTLIFNQSLNAMSVPAATAFGVVFGDADGDGTPDGYPFPQPNVTNNITITGNTVILTLDKAIEDQDIPAVITYTPPATNPLQSDPAILPPALDVDAITPVRLANNSPDDAPEIVSATLNGNMLALVFDEPVSSMDSPDAADFAIEIDGFESFQPNSDSISRTPNDLYTLTIELTLPTPLDGPALSSLDSSNIGSVTYNPSNDATKVLSGDGMVLQSTAEPLTISTSDTQPQLMRVVIDGMEVKMFFNQNLDSARLPSDPTTAYNIGVLGFHENPQVSNASLADNVITLTLDRHIGDGNAPSSVSVSYNQPAAMGERLQDASGNLVDGFSGVNIEVETPAAAPMFFDAVVDGTDLILYYNEPLDAMSIPASTNFTLAIPDYPMAALPSINNVMMESLNGITTGVRLSLNRPIPDGNVVSISYVPGANPLRDVGMNNAAGLTSESVTVETADSAPEFLLAEIRNNEIDVYFDQPLDLMSVPSSAPFPFTINVPGFDEQPEITSISLTQNLKVTLVLDRQIGVIDNPITIGYTPPSTAPLQEADTVGTLNQVAVFSENVNSRTTGVPVLNEIDGETTTITLRFDSTLDTATLDASNFTLSLPDYTDDDVSLDIVSAVINGNRVVLTLDPATSLGENMNVQITYPATGATNQIQNSNGNAVAITRQMIEVETLPQELPVLLHAEVEDGAMILHYNEDISIPANFDASDFTITLNGIATTATTPIVRNGHEIHLTLNPQVADITTIVELSYTQNSNATRRINDAGGNDAASITTPISVDNETPNRPPNILQAEIADNMLVITFDQVMDSASLPTSTDFQINFEGFSNQPSVTGTPSFNADNTQLTLQLNQSVPDAHTSVLLTYSGTSLQDNVEAVVPTIPGAVNAPLATVTTPLNITNNESTDNGPQLLRAETNAAGDEITLYYDQELVGTPANSDFALNVQYYRETSNPMGLQDLEPKVSGVTIQNNSRLVLTLDKAIADNVDVDLTYNGVTLEDPSGQNSQALSSRAIDVTVPNAAPELIYSVADENTVTLYFDQPAQSTTLDPSDFNIAVPSVNYGTGITGPEVMNAVVDMANPNIIILTLSRRVPDDAAASVSYSGNDILDSQSSLQATISTNTPINENNTDTGAEWTHFEYLDSTQQMIIYFDEDILPAAMPTLSDFIVTYSDANRTTSAVTGFTISGKTLTFDLDTARPAGSTAIVSYAGSTPSTPSNVRDADNLSSQLVSFPTDSPPELTGAEARTEMYTPPGSTMTSDHDIIRLTFNEPININSIPIRTGGDPNAPGRPVNTGDANRVRKDFTLEVYDNNAPGVNIAATTGGANDVYALPFIVRDILAVQGNVNAIDLVLRDRIGANTRTVNISYEDDPALRRGVPITDIDVSGTPDADDFIQISNVNVSALHTVQPAGSFNFVEIEVFGQTVDFIFNQNIELTAAGETALMNTANYNDINGLRVVTGGQSIAIDNSRMPPYEIIGNFIRFRLPESIPDGASANVRIFDLPNDNIIKALGAADADAMPLASNSNGNVQFANTVTVGTNEITATLASNSVAQDNMAGELTFQIDFSANVNNFDRNDLMVSSGIVSSVAVSGSRATVTVTGLTTPGQVTLDFNNNADFMVGQHRLKDEDVIMPEGMITTYWYGGTSTIAVTAATAMGTAGDDFFVIDYGSLSQTSVAVTAGAGFDTLYIIGNGTSIDLANFLDGSTDIERIVLGGTGTLDLSNIFIATGQPASDELVEFRNIGGSDTMIEIDIDDSSGGWTLNFNTNWKSNNPNAAGLEDLTLLFSTTTPNLINYEVDIDPFDGTEGRLTITGTAT